MRNGALRHEDERQHMKMNECRASSEPASVPYSADDLVYQGEQRLTPDRAGRNRVFAFDNSPSGAVAAAITSRERFPLRTLIVCFTIWLIATQAMVFDQLKFDERAHLIEQEARSFGVPQAVVPNEPPSTLPSGANLQRL
jgi:hypothetical protein